MDNASSLLAGSAVVQNYKRNILHLVEKITNNIHNERAKNEIQNNENVLKFNHS